MTTSEGVRGPVISSLYGAGALLLRSKPSLAGSRCPSRGLRNVGASTATHITKQFIRQASMVTGDRHDLLTWFYAFRSPGRPIHNAGRTTPEGPPPAMRWWAVGWVWVVDVRAVDCVGCIDVAAFVAQRARHRTAGLLVGE
jgi:hypothetical protein